MTTGKTMEKIDDKELYEIIEDLENWINAKLI